LKALSFSILLLFFYYVVPAQVSGEWYGVGNVSWAGEHNSYLSELILTQNGNKVSGEFNYFFRNASIKTKVTGTYDPKTRTIELQARPVLNYQAKDVNGADCPMEGSFTLRTSRLETTLTGQFNPTYSYRFTCPAINIKFKREQPDKKTSSPEVVNKPVEKENLLEKLMKEQFPEEKPDTTAKFTDALQKRSFDLSPVIDVDSDSLKVILYDNGEVDQDTISMFYNRKLVAHKQMLSDKPLTLMLPLDTTINEIAMYAENLGRIPPNTALAIVYAGEQRFELYMTSNFIKNATIRFRKKTK
jgi:hypothetical protein